MKPLDMRSFRQEVLEEKKFKTVIIKCSHSKCTPCKVWEPFLKQLAEEVKGKIKVLCLDTIEQDRLAKSLDIRSVPCLIKYVQGYEVDRIIGKVADEKVKKFFKG